MNLDLSDEETGALAKELAHIIGNDRYPFPERIRTLKAILAKAEPFDLTNPAKLVPPRERKARVSAELWQ